VFVLLGDGECDEGQVWEAALCAAHYGLSNLVAVVDANGMQLDGNTDDVMRLGDLEAKWRAFGWEVRDVDGHDIPALLSVFRSDGKGPVAVIAHTVKGKGISFMEQAPAWHHGRLGKKQFEQAIAELEDTK
jgi:transketolase